MLTKLFPPVCVNCKKEWAILCDDCKKKLVPHPPLCPYCHQHSQDFKTCTACKATWKDAYLNGLIVCFSYNIVIKKAILKLKYYHKKFVADFLTTQLGMAFHSNPTLLNEININHWETIITWVPSHRIRRHFIKWYNQSYILAKKLAEKVWLKYDKIVYKTKNTKSQVNLNRNERKENLKNVFAMYKMLKWDETIVIIDDITTTWSTINEIAKTIKEIYPNVNVWWMVLARHNH